MSPPTPSDDPSPPPTHYEVLAIPADFAHQEDPAALLRAAYRRALLRHHPDKTAPAAAPTGPRRAPRFSVDQIAAAFAALSSPAARAAYDRSLALAGAPPTPAGFRTGVETVDLDDLAHDGAGRWYRACRCGNARGFAFAEDDLEAAADTGELLVGCLDCSLWLRVHFAVVQAGDEVEDDDGEAAVPKHGS